MKSRRKIFIFSFRFWAGWQYWKKITSKYWGWFFPVSQSNFFLILFQKYVYCSIHTWSNDFFKFFHISFYVKFRYMRCCDFRINDPQNTCLVTLLLTWNITFWVRYSIKNWVNTKRRIVMSTWELVHRYSKYKISTYNHEGVGLPIDRNNFKIISKFQGRMLKQRRH